MNVKKLVLARKGFVVGVTAGGALALIAVGVVAAGGPSNTSGQVAANLPTAVTTANHSKVGRRHHALDRRGTEGKVTDITAQTLTIKTARNVTMSYGLTSTTAYREAGTSISSSAITDGDVVLVRTARSSTVATMVRVVPPLVAGDITSINGSTITIANQFGLVRTIDTSQSTTYREAKMSIQEGALAVGDHIIAVGTVTANGEVLDASRIVLSPATYAGTVTSVTSGAITLRRFDGSTVTIDTGSGTTFRMGKSTATASAVSVGERIIARGTVSNSGTMDAISVWILRTHAHSQSTNSAPASTAVV